MWNLKKNINTQNENILIDTENKPKGRGIRDAGLKGDGIKKYRMVVTK